MLEKYIEKDSSKNNDQLLVDWQKTITLKFLLSVLNGNYESKVEVEVYDMTSRLVATDSFIKDISMEQKTVSFPELSNGIYFVTLRMKNKTLQTKIIVSK